MNNDSRTIPSPPLLRRYVISVIASLLLLAIYKLQQPIWPERMVNPLWAKALFDQQGQLLDLHIAADQQWRLPYQPKHLPADPQASSAMATTQTQGKPLETTTLPRRYETALLTFEDQYFYQHPGINPLAVLRATWGNLNAGQVKSGASTITMQVARLLYGNQTRNLQQKLRETELALQLEWHFDKAQILQLYANNAPYGGNIVGLTAASWWYFGREPAALSWSEAALLAVLPNSPGLIHPGRRADLLQQKRDRLLQKLYAQGHFDETDLKLALLEPIPVKPAGWPALAPHLLHTLMARNPKQALFYTDLDRQLQIQLNELLTRQARSLAVSGVANGAVLIIDHQQMKIRAYVGNIGSGDGASVDIIQSRRSTGSILKPFLYALMLDDGLMTPQSLLPDVPSQFGGYAPVNFDLQFRGAAKASEALAQSLNVPAVRMLYQYGVGRFRQQLQSFGLTTINKGADHYGLSLILGGAEATLFDLTRSYAAMVHLAAKPQATIPALPLRFGSRPQNLSTANNRKEGGVPLDAINLPVSAGAAYLTLDALLEVERPESEGSWRDYVRSQKIAWKTGTSFGLRDAWAVGMNGQYTIGVWTGNADGSPAAILGGARSAGPILFDSFRLLPDSPWLMKPLLALRQQEICASDGYRTRWQCQTALTDMPIASQLKSPHSYQQQLWLDPSGRFQLPAGCALEVPRQASTRLILPVAMAYFYQPQHPEYQGVPPTWPGCEPIAQQQMDLLYPVHGAQIRLPLQLDGKLGQSIFRAIHRDKQAQIYWHLDETYLGQTSAPHQMPVQAAPGQHRLVLTASDGSRLEQPFTILGDEPTHTCQGQSCNP